MSQDLEQTLGRLLTFGTRVTTGVLALGLAATFAFPASRFTHALLTVGLLVLLLTPVSRVAVSVVGFLRARDWWFVLYTSIVLVLLLVSFVAAFG
jgi:predicted membrane protein